MINTGLTDKVVLITGANHGIGAATAKAFAAQGVAVFINYLRLPPLGTHEEGNEAENTDIPGLALYNAHRANIVCWRWSYNVKNRLKNAE